MKSSLLVIALLASVFAGTTQAATRVQAPLVPVGTSEALADATALAALHGDARVMQVSGSSMLPFFGSGSLLVVKAVKAAQLSKGMVVVYRNNFGETVAHRLVNRTATGWIAQGYNNSAADSTLVTEANLRGVVYATVHTAGLPVVASAARHTPEVVLAAPAR